MYSKVRSDFPAKCMQINIGSEVLLFQKNLTQSRLFPAESANLFFLNWKTMRRSLLRLGFLFINFFH